MCADRQASWGWAGGGERHTAAVPPSKPSGERAFQWAEEAGYGQEQGQNLELGTKIPSLVSAVTDILEHVT